MVGDLGWLLPDWSQDCPLPKDESTSFRAEDRALRSLEGDAADHGVFDTMTTILPPAD